MLHQFVNDQGLVNYTALKQDRANLDRYYALIAAYSPDSSPRMFPTEQSRLAYWLNAYNAAVIETVLNYYPIASVEDVKPPGLLFFMPRKSGFFLFQRITLGGETKSLYSLENSIIRRRFADPRVHFALNCASRGCPRLPRYAFTAEQLDHQLDLAARQFVAEPRNLQIDHETRTVWMSSIFKWYQSDFTGWYRQRYPDKAATVANYVALYLPPEEAADLMSSAAYRVRFFEYDWRLNDQNPTR
ncbi:MAG: DUF547 domain-containing protein [Candidatus Binataceae bacterium]